jgi:hypothetical protein
MTWDKIDWSELKELSEKARHETTEMLREYNQRRQDQK